MDHYVRIRFGIYCNGYIVLHLNLEYASKLGLERIIFRINQKKLELHFVCAITLEFQHDEHREANHAGSRGYE